MILFRAQKIIGIRMLSPWYESDFLWNLSKHKRRLNKYQQIGKEMMESVRHDRYI